MRFIGEAARLSGVNIETIRYYEREGVVPAPQRSSSGRRIYDADGVARLRFIRRCRDLGFSLQSARALLSLAIGCHGPCSDARAIGENHLLQVRAKLAELVQLETVLSQLVARCDDADADCPMLHELLASECSPTRPVSTIVDRG